MNVALIFAGGIGSRMNSHSKPKQFLEVNGKAIIIHTIEKFEAHPHINAIVVVCINEWIGRLQKMLHLYNITKVVTIIEGGTTGSQSIYKGLTAIAQHYPTNPTVLIHDGVRPLINEQLISNNIQMVDLKGSAITVAPAIETIVNLNNDGQVDGVLDRSDCFYAKAPQSFKLNAILEAHQQAIKEDKHHLFVDSASLMAHYGHPLFTVAGGYENIKITTPSDFYMFKALLEQEENSQVFGF